MVHRFEDLDVFQRAYKLSLDVHRKSLTMPPIEQAALADQVRRASKSICANLAEGFGRQAQSHAEFKRFRVRRRDAGVDSLLPRFRVYRPGDLAALARRVRTSREDAARVVEQGLIPDP